MNLPILLQERLNYPPLQKIDPNTQEVTGKSQSSAGAFSQAAIPILLAGFYKLSRTDEGAGNIVSEKFSPQWVQNLFPEHSSEIIKRVADYAAISTDDAANQMETVAAAAVQLIKELSNTEHPATAVNELLSHQVNNILHYLPAAVQSGQLMNENTFDDRTNKMDGPISSLMQNIGAGFSGSTKDEKKL